MLDCTQEMACQRDSAQVILLQHIPHYLGVGVGGGEKNVNKKNCNLQEVFSQSLKRADRKQEPLSNQRHGYIKLTLKSCKENIAGYMIRGQL